MNVERVNKYRSVSSLILFSIVLVFGIVFLVLFLAFNKPVPENYVETNAKITRIEGADVPVYDETESVTPDYQVFVQYSYAGKTYSEKEYGKYDSSWKEGDEVLVYVNPDNPDDFMSDPSGEIVFIIIGIVIILIGIGGIGYNIYKKKENK